MSPEDMACHIRRGTAQPLTFEVIWYDGRIIDEMTRTGDQPVHDAPEGRRPSGGQAKAKPACISAGSTFWKG